MLGIYWFAETMQTYRESSILDFEGSVAMIIKSAGDGDGSVYNLWTLDDGCRAVSWTKKFTLVPDLDFSKFRVCCFLGSGHFAADGVNECRLYDCYKKKEIEVHLRVSKAVEEQNTLVLL